MPFCPLWDSILDSLKMHRISPDVIGKWTWILACAQRHDPFDGNLPDLAMLTFWLRHSEEEIQKWLDELVAAKLVDRKGKTYTVHDWQQWRCTKDPKARTRMQRMRERNKNEGRNGKVTESVTSHVTPAVTPKVAPESRGCDALELGEVEKRKEHAAPAHAERGDLVTGREPKDHADFLRAIEILEGHESTARLGGHLFMHADTPGVTMFEGWRLIVAAMVAQRPDKTKSWNALLSYARQATLEEFDKLTKKIPASTRLRVVHDPGPTNQPISAQNLPEGLEQFTERANRNRELARKQGLNS